jgi:hypothetical protein
LSLPARTETFRCQEHAQLERHVEARQSAGGSHLGPRDVMHAVLARGDDLEDLVDPYLAGIIDFQGAPGSKAASEDREDDGLEKRPVLRVKRTVEEHTPVVSILSHRTPTASAGPGGRPGLS